MIKNDSTQVLASSVSPQTSCEKCPVAWSELYLGGLALYNLISSYLSEMEILISVRRLHDIAVAIRRERIRQPNHVCRCNMRKNQAYHMSTAFFTIEVIFFVLLFLLDDPNHKF